MNGYASQTTIAPEKTRSDIEKLVTQAGAHQFVSGWDSSTATATIMFKMTNRVVRFQLSTPPMDTFKYGKGSRLRSQGQMQEKWEQEIRRRWRVMLLVIKGKLETVESGLRTFEQEFLSDIVMPDGSTVGEAVSPGIAIAYESGRMQPLLLSGPTS